MSNFKVRYIRLNKPCILTIVSKNQISSIDFIVTGAYFREYKDTFDVFYIVEGVKKTYIKTVSRDKVWNSDIINFHINLLNSGCYIISIDDIIVTEFCHDITRKIEKLEEDIYGK